MPKQAMDYSKTIIYKITCNDATVLECYVGHTTNFKSRKNQHKSSCNVETSKEHNYKLYQMIREHGGWNNWNMTPICEYSCENHIQACIKEEECRIELQASLNMQKCYVGLPLIEYSKQYYESKKDVILEKCKEYRKINKKQISEKFKEKFECICGSILRKRDIKQHERSKKHQNFILNSNSNGEKD